MPATKTKSQNITAALNRLAQVGVAPAFARQVLPQWWDDEIAEEPAGLQQAEMYFARAFNIDLLSFSKPSMPLTFSGSACKFKLRKDVNQGEVHLSAHFATGIAKTALAAFEGQADVPLNPEALREQVLAGAACVDLPSLLGWCARARIPVLHVEKLPSKKMAGLVVRDHGKFAIVLCKRAHPAYLLFYLAHELGHVARGHLPADGFVADERIGNGDDQQDADEKEADAYAIRLLNGKHVGYVSQRRYITAKDLAAAALQKGKQDRVDPGHIVLNLAHSQRLYAVGNAALKLIPGPAAGPEVVNELFFDSLEADQMSPDTLDLLRRVTEYQKRR